MKLLGLIIVHFALYASLWWMFPKGVNAGLVGCVAGLLIWISVWDILTFEIPDSATVALTLVAGAILVVRPPISWEDMALGAVLWPVLFYAVARMFEKQQGVVGLGFGDVKLMVPIGLLCGALATVHVVMMASVAGVATMAVVAILRKQSLHDQAVALGPFLAASCWAVWLSLG